MIYALDTVLIISIALAWYFGILAMVWQYDNFYFCTGISAIGLGYYILGHWTHKHSRLGMEDMFTLGLIGTMLGVFMMASSGGDLYAKLPGALLAFLSTLTGAVWGMILRHQSWMCGERS